MMLAQLLPGFQSLSCYPQANWALLVRIPGWVVLCMFQDPVDLSNKLSCEVGSFSHCPQHPQVFSVRAFGALFPTLEPWVARSVSLPSCSSQFICTQNQPPPYHKSSPRQLPISTPPTGLDECFFFNSLVVGLP